MAKSAVVFVANGCGAVEVVAPVDALRRGGVDVVLAAVSDDLTVRAAQAVTLQADAPAFHPRSDAVRYRHRARWLGGRGQPGQERPRRGRAHAPHGGRRVRGRHLRRAHGARQCGAAHRTQGRVLPRCEEGWPAGVYQAGKDVFVDGNLITATGPGTALPFGIQILRTLEGDKVADGSGFGDAVEITIALPLRDEGRVVTSEGAAQEAQPLRPSCVSGRNLLTPFSGIFYVFPGDRWVNTRMRAMCGLLHST